MANKIKRTPERASRSSAEVAKYHYERLCDKFGDMVASTTARPEQFQLLEEKIRIAHREMLAVSSSPTVQKGEGKTKD